MADKQLRLVSYRRISNERPDGTSMMEQARCIGLRIEADGHRWLADFHDIESAEHADRRSGFQQALKYIYDGHADGLVVYKLDRYARSVADGVMVLKELRKRGKCLICVRDPIDTSTSLGEAMFQIALVFGELERKTIRDRLFSGRTARSRQRRYGFGRPPAGYQTELVDGVKQLVKAPNHDEIIDFIHQCRAEGHSWRSVARLLSDKYPPPGQRSIGNNQWNYHTVRSMVKGQGKLRRWVESGYAFDYHRPITTALVDDVKRLRLEGFSLTAIADLKDIGYCTVRRILSGDIYISQ